MHIIKNLFALILMLSISACSLTNSMWNSDDAESENPTYSEKGAGGSIDKYEFDKKQRLITKYIEEWEEIKPTLTKVIALESELTYVLNALDTANSSVPKSLNITKAEDSPNMFLTEFDLSDESQALSKSGVMFRNDGNNNASANKSNPSNKFSTQNVSYNDQAVSVGKARQLSSTLSKNLKEDSINQTDNKFSSDNIVVVPETINKTKFSSPDLEERCSAGSQATIGSGFAIHLASYSKLNSVDVGQKTFQEKYANRLCNKETLVKKVNVNGRDFYSLRFGPYASKLDAQTECEFIKADIGYCTVSQFDGERLN